MYTSQPTSTHQSGLSILELSISLVIVTILVAVAMSVTVESSRYFDSIDTSYALALEVDRAFGRLGEELRRSGWNDDGSKEYPAVSPDGTELEFRVLRDLDGNSELFDSDTGELEWGATVYIVRRDPADETLAVYDDAGNVALVLGRHVVDVRFATYLEDPSLQLREIRVGIVTADQESRGETVSYDLTGSIHMRN